MIFFPAFLAFIYFIFSALSEYQEQKDFEKTNSKIDQGFDNVLQEVKRDDDPFLKVKKGFSLYIALYAKEILDLRRKHLLDFGASESNNRVSVYFDIENNLVFRIIDQTGETFSCKIPTSSYTIHPDIPFMIYCDFGSSESYSFLRMSVNNNELCRTTSPNKINFLSDRFYDTSKASLFSMVRKLNYPYLQGIRSGFVKNDIGGYLNADMKGGDNSFFTALELVIMGKLLPKNEIDNIWSDVRDKVFPYSKFFKKYLPSTTKYYKFVDGDLQAVE